MIEKDVPGFEGRYVVSDAGQVRSLIGAGRVRKVQVDRYGYVRVDLWLGNRRYSRKVHRLVLEAFVGPRPEGMDGLHRNGDQTDNRLENLYWGTKSEIMLDAVEHGTHGQARKTHCKRNHEFTEENTRIGPSGGRWCRACDRLRGSGSSRAAVSRET